MPSRESWGQMAALTVSALGLPVHGQPHTNQTLGGFCSSRRPSALGGEACSPSGRSKIPVIFSQDMRAAISKVYVNQGRMDCSVFWQRCFSGAPMPATDLEVLGLTSPGSLLSTTSTGSCRTFNLQQSKCIGQSLEGYTSLWLLLDTASYLI